MWQLCCRKTCALKVAKEESFNIIHTYASHFVFDGMMGIFIVCVGAACSKFPHQPGKPELGWLPLPPVGAALSWLFGPSR
jgi:hypothetical protein